MSSRIAPSPLGVYGHTKAEAERQLEHEAPQALIIRTSAFFGPWDCHNFVAAVLRTVRGGGVFHASQSIISPTYVPDLCHASLDLLLDGERGVYSSSEPRRDQLGRFCATCGAPGVTRSRTDRGVRRFRARILRSSPALQRARERASVAHAYSGRRSGALF